MPSENPQADSSSVYAPETVESLWLNVWADNNLFSAQADPSRKPYTIVIPPPNVTGSLHMGHALNNTLQDVLIRRRRMRGDNALWIPGTDHGGIATQNVVEKILKKEGKTRHDLGRKKFLERMWDWRRESGDMILHQLKKLGCALDWSRTRFTMDDASSAAVTHAFIAFYNQKLLYRGFRLVNWCSRCATALADIEVEHEEKKGSLWHIRYPFEDEPGEGVVVATTRPETLLGDTAVAVNPEDERYKKLLGKKLRLPLMNRSIPLLADAAVDASFGTGAVKVTPAHDAVDFDIGQRHNLPHEMVIGYDGLMTERAGAYKGLSVKAAREKVLADLEAGGFLVKTEDYKLSVATCYRCDTAIEPLESSQWFLKTQDMARRAAEATRKKEVRIFPESWEKPYLNWLDNNRDWCVSRQIWWGHQIPVWYCLDCENIPQDIRDKVKKDPEFKEEETKLGLREFGEPIVEEKAPDKCPRCGGRNLIQDPDVLDTWFSSGLWPLTTLGWPRETPDLNYFYPTSVLVTGHEILYLWVARMVMMGLALRNKIPYKHVFIHGIVRDKQGRKMSKSLNNVIDPLDVMKKYGTDALRFALVSMAAPGRDMQMSDDSFVGARNFANKIWNASRFVISNLEGFRPSGIPLAERDLADRWIYRRLEETLQTVEADFIAYDMAQAARTLYAFFWGDFCDWYIELTKLRLQGPYADAAAREAAKQTLYEVLDGVLRALHPLMPFITDEIWRALQQTVGGKTEAPLLAAPPYILPSEKVGEDDMKAMSFLMETVSALRTTRSEMNLPLGKFVPVILSGGFAVSKDILTRYAHYVRHLAKVESFRWLAAGEAKPRQSTTDVVGDVEISILLEGLIDFEKEKQRIQKEISAAEAYLGREVERLKNPDFLARAPKDEVEKSRARADETEAKIKRLRDRVKSLSS